MALLCRGTPRTTRSCFFKAGEKGSFAAFLSAKVGNAAAEGWPVAGPLSLSGPWDSHWA